MPSSAGRTLFDVIHVWELEPELERAEREIIEELRATADFIPTGIAPIDYLVAQVRFAKAGLAQAERRGLRGIPALEWVEYLSWPECCRQAKTGWRRDLLRRMAFEERVGCWQRALDARHPEDSIGVGPPRTVIFPPATLQLGPYPSDLEPTDRPTRQAPACLEANIYFDLEQPNPLRPVRRLDGLTSWALLIQGAWLYRGRSPWMQTIQVIIDEPRTYSARAAQEWLLAQAGRFEATLQAARSATPPIPEAVAATWAGQIAGMQAAAEILGRAGTAERATILEHLFTLPGTVWMAAVEVLTDDLPPEWLGVMLGFAFDRRGMLSVRETKHLRKAAAAVLEHWQASRYPHREVGVVEAERLVTRLARLRRPLQPASLFAYLAKLVRGARPPRN